MKTFDCNTWLWEQARKASREWSAIQMRDMFASVYLWHCQGELRAAKDKPEGFELSDGRRLGPSGTPDQMMHHIYNLARRLPCLPLEKAEVSQ